MLLATFFQPFFPWQVAQEMRNHMYKQNYMVVTDEALVENVKKFLQVDAAIAAILEPDPESLEEELTTITQDEFTSVAHFSKVSLNFIFCSSTSSFAIKKAGLTLPTNLKSETSDTNI